LTLTGLNLLSHNMDDFLENGFPHIYSITSGPASCSAAEASEANLYDDTYDAAR
jgi:hypothetical protein